MESNHTLMRPTRDLLLQLPLLTVNEKSEIDYAASDPALLLLLAGNAEIVMNSIHHGLSAVGQILAHAAPEVGNEISTESMESLGWLMAEVSDLAATAFSTACRRHTVGSGQRYGKLKDFLCFWMLDCGWFAARHCSNPVL